MDFSNLSQLLGPFQDQFLKIYSVTSFVISLVIGLWLLNFLFGLIQRTYFIGKAFGSLYRVYMHSYLRTIIIRAFNLFKTDNQVNSKT